jgi:hypothetical protein
MTQNQIYLVGWIAVGIAAIAVIYFAIKKPKAA